MPINGFRWSTSICLCQQSRRTMENEKIIKNVYKKKIVRSLQDIIPSFLVNLIIDDVAGKKYKVNKPGVHVVIDEWIDHGVAHGQPIERKEDVLDVFIRDDLTVNELVNEVAVIGQPTDGEE